MRGKLIIFEGINGSGKSFYINKLINNEYLPNTVYFKFPDRTTSTGQKIDKFLKKEINISTNERKNLFINNILEQKINILNKLNQGLNVICDRYIISTLTYEYTEIINDIYNNNNLNQDTILTLINVIKYKMLPKPDIIFLINGNHINKRNEEIQRYHNSIYNNIIFNNYITIMTLMNEKFEIINNININDTQKNINNIISKISLLNNNNNINLY